VQMELTQYIDCSPVLNVLMTPLLTDRCEGDIVFGLSVRECVLPSVRAVSTISYKPADGILPNFG